MTMKQTTTFGAERTSINAREMETLERCAAIGLQMGEIAVMTLSRTMSGVMAKAEADGDKDAQRVIGSGSGHATMFLQMMTPALEAVAGVHTASALDPRGAPGKDEQQRVADAVEAVGTFVEAVINIVCRVELQEQQQTLLCKEMGCKPHHVDMLARQVARDVAKRFNVSLAPVHTTFSGKGH